MSWNQKPIKAGQRTRTGRVVTPACAAEYARLTELAELARRTGLKATCANLIDRRSRLLRALPQSKPCPTP